MESEVQKANRLDQAAKRKVRALSGWNVFQRKMMSESGALEPDEYKKRVREVSSTWKSYTPEEKEPYIIQAKHEQEAREALSQEPLAVKGESKSDLETLVGKSGCKKVSAKRLLVSKEIYQSHEMWSTPTQLGDGAIAWDMARVCAHGV